MGQKRETDEGELEIMVTLKRHLCISRASVTGAGRDREIGMCRARGHSEAQRPGDLKYLRTWGGFMDSPLQPLAQVLI